MEHRGSKRLDRAIAAQLQLGGAFDVVEHRVRRPPSREALEVRDRAHTAPAVGRATPERRPDEPRDLRRSRKPPLHSPTLDRLELLERLPAARRSSGASGTASGRRCSRASSCVEPQYGQRKTFDCSCTSCGAPASRGAGGAKPAARSFSRPAAVILSVDHESSWITRTSGSAPSAVDLLLERALHRLERGTAEERRRELHADVSVRDIDRTDDAEVDERDDGDLRIGDLVERLPDLLGRHHCAPAGAERRTIVISFQSSASSSVCVPRSTASTSSRPDARRERVALLGRQHAERVRPELLDRGAELRRVAQPLVPHLRVHAVVRLLAVDLRGEAGDRGVVVLHQRRDADLVGDLVEPAARDRVAPSRAGAARRAARSGTRRARGRTRARRRRPSAARRRARAWPISFCAIDENATSSSSIGAMPVHSESRQPMTSSSSARPSSMLVHAPPSVAP